MKKRFMLVALLVLCAAVLCACGSQEQTKYQVVTSNAPAQATQNLNIVPTDVPAAPADEELNFDDGSYDPTLEEGDDTGFVPEYEEIPVVTVAPTMTSEYAGATPVILDPIDKPTPSPVPPLTFAYQTYEATNIHLAFEAPVGWTISEPAADTFTLTNPSQNVDYAASLTIRAVPVSSDYSENDLVKEVKSMLDTISEAGFNSFSPSNTATRTLLDKNGVYANYTGKLPGGVEVAGRVHATCLNRVLYTVHVTYPRAYTDTYKEQVYDKLRQTISITQ